MLTMVSLTDSAGEESGNVPGQWSDPGNHGYFGGEHRTRYVPHYLPEASTKSRKQDRINTTKLNKQNLERHIRVVHHYSPDRPFSPTNRKSMSSTFHTSSKIDPVLYTPSVVLSSFINNPSPSKNINISRPGSLTEAQVHTQNPIDMRLPEKQSAPLEILFQPPQPIAFTSSLSYHQSTSLNSRLSLSVPVTQSATISTTSTCNASIFPATSNSSTTTPSSPNTTLVPISPTGPFISTRTVLSSSALTVQADLKNDSAEPEPSPNSSYRSHMLYENEDTNGSDFYQSVVGGYEPESHNQGGKLFSSSLNDSTDHSSQTTQDSNGSTDSDRGFYLYLAPPPISPSLSLHSQPSMVHSPSHSLSEAISKANLLPISSPPLQNDVQAQSYEAPTSQSTSDNLNLLLPQITSSAFQSPYPCSSYAFSQAPSIISSDTLAYQSLPLNSSRL
ncbi:unnamed protein product, partial [Protopolystoma xenopodis]